MDAEKYKINSLLNQSLSLHSLLLLEQLFMLTLKVSSEFAAMDTKSGPIPIIITELAKCASDKMWRNLTQILSFPHREKKMSPNCD